MRQIFSLFVFAVFAASVYASDDGGKDVGFMVPHPVQGVLKTYCYDCHGEKKSKGKIRFDTFSELEIKSRLDLMNKMQEQIHFTEMPVWSEVPKNRTPMISLAVL